MSDQEMLQKLKSELDQLLQIYKQTNDVDDLSKANILRMQYAELDVKLNGGKK